MKWIVTLQRIDNELGIVLPEDLIERMGLNEGDEFDVVERDGGLLLIRSDPMARAMEVYDEGSRKYRNALRELADS